MTLSIKHQPDYGQLEFTEALTRAQHYQVSQLLTHQPYDGKTISPSMQELTDDFEYKPEMQQMTAQMHKTEPSLIKRTDHMICFHCQEKGHGIKQCPPLNKNTPETAELWDGHNQQKE